MSTFAAARRNMVDGQLRTFDVTDRAILAAFGDVPREGFVPAGREALAYGDQNLALPGDPADPRVMLAPMVLARMIQALALDRSSRVLDVAGGLGYSAAVMAALGADIVMLEPRRDLSDAASRALAAAGLGGQVRSRAGSPADGAAADGPFDAILINGAVEERPTALLDQLVDGGRLACITADGRTGRATLHIRSGTGFGFRMLFDASAPVLSAFRHAPAFAF